MGESLIIARSEEFELNLKGWENVQFFEVGNGLVHLGWDLGQNPFRVAEIFSAKFESSGGGEADWGTAKSSYSLADWFKDRGVIRVGGEIFGFQLLQNQTCFWGKEFFQYVKT